MLTDEGMNVYISYARIFKHHLAVPKFGLDCTKYYCSDAYEQHSAALKRRDMDWLTLDFSFKGGTVGFSQEAGLKQWTGREVNQVELWGVLESSRAMQSWAELSWAVITYPMPCAENRPARLPPAPVNQKDETHRWSHETCSPLSWTQITQKNSSYFFHLWQLIIIICLFSHLFTLGWIEIGVEYIA